MPARRGLALVAAATLAVAAAGDGLADEPLRRLTFNPNVPAQTEWFLVTEFSASWIASGFEDEDLDRFLFTDAIGVMKNVGPRRAIGGSIEVHLAQGSVKAAPTLRWKEWLGGTRSLDLALAYVPSDTKGLIGPLVNLRYSPTRFIHLQAGACRVREVGYTYGPAPTYVIQFHDQRESRLYAGIGFGGAAGAALWGGQAVGVAFLAWVVSGME